jgi:hypothetical protein
MVLVANIVAKSFIMASISSLNLSGCDEIHKWNPEHESLNALSYYSQKWPEDQVPGIISTSL